MQQRSTYSILRHIGQFFPVRLLILHVKKNHFLLFFWVLLFGFTTGFLASRFGVPQQFLVPEYRGGTGYLSFACVGFALGGFITAFNLYTYIMHGYRFPFIATLARPFHKFSLNNFVIPLAFILTYAACSAVFQLEKEFIPPRKVAQNILSFFAGVAAFQSLSYFYFRYTNKDARAYGRARKRPMKESAPVAAPLQQSTPWSRHRNRHSRWNVDTYLSSTLRIARARDSHHYDRHVLERVFYQNHINAARFELVLVVSFLLIGSQRENDFFVIPAAASALLFFTMLLMLISALHSWIKGWTFTLFIVLLVVLNFFYADLRVIRLESRAYGIDYDTAQVRYDLLALRPTEDTVEKDMAHTIGILERWKARVSAPGDAELPKLIIIDCSGGGSRSAFWTMRSLAHADEATGGRLLDHAVLMTGASGGMFGAAFLRELYLRHSWGEDVSPWDTVYSEQMAMDLLNPVILSTAVNDWFIRYQRLEDGPYSYTKDRAWAFERQVSLNSRGAFDRRMQDYAQPEEEARIPMLVLTPTIVNDGRRLVIASQPVSYLARTYALNGTAQVLPEDIEFSRMFQDNDPGHLRFISALRMNATFPYVLPITTLPSDPPIGIMDAGIRDNFGLKTTLHYLHTFAAWINANTSGVIIVQVRDLPKGMDLDDHRETLFGRFLAPMGSIYGNMTKTQDYNNEQMLRYLKASYDTPIDLITFQLEQDKDSHISLSWHLTQAERRQIRRSTQDPYFRNELERLRHLLGLEAP